MLPLLNVVTVTISIHAPARGATSQMCLLLRLSTISIHAPARGATSLANAKACADQFQSTLPRGERPRKRVCFTVLLLFQSTLPRGERRAKAPDTRKFTTYFNPRSREGSDAATLDGTASDVISIHAPARGATMVE